MKAYQAIVINGAFACQRLLKAVRIQNCRRTKRFSGQSGIVLGRTGAKNSWRLCRWTPRLRARFATEPTAQSHLHESLCQEAADLQRCAIAGRASGRLPSGAIITSNRPKRWSGSRGKPRSPADRPTEPGSRYLLVIDGARVTNTRLNDFVKTLSTALLRSADAIRSMTRHL